MSTIRLAFELFILYLLYKLVFELIIPVVKTTKKVKQQFGDLNAQMEAKMNEQQRTTTTSAKPAQPVKPKNNDYIDFEEVK